MKLVKSDTYQPVFSELAAELIRDFKLELQKTGVFLSVIKIGKEGRVYLYCHLNSLRACEKSHSPAAFVMSLAGYKAVIERAAMCDYRIVSRPKPNKRKKSCAVYGYDSDLIIIEPLVR